MKPSPAQSTGSAGRWAALGLIALLAVALAWQAIHRRQLVRQALPPRPDVSHRAPALADEISAADTAARSWRKADAGLARLAGLYHANGFFAEASACYRILAQLEPQEARWPHLIANIEASFGRLADALPWQRQAVQLAPDNFIVHLRLGDLLFKDNAVGEAEKAYTRAHQIAPGNPYVLLGLARCSLRREDWAQARAYLREAVAAQSDFVGAWALLASVEVHFGDQAAGNFARQRGNGQFQEISDPWLGFLNDLSYDPYQLSVAAAMAAKPAEARNLLERAIAISPEVAAYHRQLAQLLTKARDNAGARTHLEKAVALAPDDAEAWSALVTLLIETQDSRAAVAALAQGLQNCPQSGFLHFTNGRRLAAMAQPAAAMAELNLAKRFQPAEVRAYIELSTLYVQAGRVPEAIAEAQGALAVDPANITVLGMLAQLNIMEGNEAEAIRWSRKIRASATDESSTLNQIQAMFQQQFSHPLSY